MAADTPSETPDSEPDEPGTPEPERTDSQAAAPAVHDAEAPGSETPPPPAPPPPPSPPPAAAAPPPGQAPGGSHKRLGLVVLAVAGVALVGVVVAVLVGALGRSGETITARGGEVSNAEELLDDIEEGLQELLHVNINARAEVATDGTVRCWYSYPDEAADEPNDFVRCGPLMFADSEENTLWLRLPVSFRGEGDGVLVALGELRPRTWALEAGEDLRRPDGRSAPVGAELTRPPAEVADPGRTGRLTPDALMVDLDEPAGDGRLVGIGYELEVVGTAATDRVRLPEAFNPPDQSGVLEAAEGEEWLVFQLTGATDLRLADAPSFVVTIDGDDRPLEIDTSLGLDWVLAASVPTGATEIMLTVEDELLSQSWSFTTADRTGDAPDVLYRDPDTRVATVSADLSLPYAANDLNALPGADYGEFGSVPGLDFSEAFGDNDLQLTIRDLRLHYAVATSAVNGVPEYRTASGPDRALLYPVGVNERWGDIMHSGYVLDPEDAVVILEDGTEIAATRIPADVLDWATFEDVDDIGTWDGPIELFGGFFVWDVPADIESATLTLSPRPGRDNLDMYELDFEGGTLRIEIDFAR